MRTHTHTQDYHGMANTANSTDNEAYLDKVNMVNFSQNITHECLISALTLSLTFIHLWYVIFDNRVGVKYKMMLI